MPMFPLGMVLLPGSVLPLHVFEPRYQLLVQDCLAAATQEFGVVLIQRGSEVGGGDERVDVGTAARMLQVSPLGGGRFAVITVGHRRIRITRWLPDDPYPQAEVLDWPDAESVPDGDRVEAVLRKAKRCAGLSVELGDSAGVPEVTLTGDGSLDSFAIAAVSPLGAADRYRVLCAPDPGARVELIDELLDDVEATLRFRLG